MGVSDKLPSSSDIIVYKDVFNLVVSSLKCMNLSGPNRVPDEFRAGNYIGMAYAKLDDLAEDPEGFFAWVFPEGHFHDQTELRNILRSYLEIPRTVPRAKLVQLVEACGKTSL